LKLVLAPPFDRLWRKQDPFEAVEELEGPVFRQLEKRRTFRTDVEGQSYFVKIHRGVGWSEIFKNLLYFRRPVLGADHEWLAIRKLEELGVPTMKAVAFASRGRNPARRCSFIVTEDLGDTVSLEAFTKNWPTNAPPVKLKRALIAKLAGLTRTMHRGGVNHRDYYLCHFLLHDYHKPDPGDLKLSLIDLHRAQIRSRVPRRWCDKDLAALYFSALHAGLTDRDLLRFLQIYFAAPIRQILAEEKCSLRRLRRKALQLQDIYDRKFAPLVKKE
jgi:heptose I phosphotransferase